MSDDYKVGYKRPPKKNRFRKGKSGNPAGRPRKKLDPIVVADGAILRRLDQLTVTVGGRVMTRRHAELLKIREASLAGNRKAQRLLNKLRTAMPEKAGGGVLHLPASHWEEQE